ncbi:MAG: CCA tRNA nucleotidyltransferase, partial [Candidatus Electryoneaceae bacterium]|nr:CCA tRNA nucleotidyltransferase [Candidatus Electryoneaceae bacterium]
MIETETSNPVRIKDIKRDIVALLPPEFIEIANELGYELYAVGGIVRDLLLGRSIIDGDIDLSVVGDAPNLAQEIADRLDVRDVSIYSRFGTALVRIGKQNYELATARAESYRSDSRKPAEVVPVSIEEDLSRRDFTVNALALGITGPHGGELLDLSDGLKDLARRVLRTPLDPDRTFSDDPLRMLRAIRFATKLDFNIDPATWDGIRSNTDRLSIVAAERIGDEFMKMLGSADPVRAMELLIDSGLMD